MTTRPRDGLKIGYILKRFPRLSETFILNELLELERQGTELSVYSLYYPDDGRFHGRLGELEVTAEYFQTEKAEVLWSRLRELAPGLAPSFESWTEAADFLGRHGIPRPLDLLLRSSLIAARARQQGVQHLHAHFATISTRVAALVNILSGIPYSFTAHAKDIFRETVDRALFAELTNRAAFAVTVSDFNRQFILERTPGIDPTKLERLYNGIDLGFFKAEATPVVAPSTAKFAATDSATGSARDSNAPHILSIGRLVPKKGFPSLLRTLRLCKDREMPFKATIVGDGEGMAELVELRSRLDLDREVELTGGLPQEQVRQLCRETTLVALACTTDADGNTDALPTVLLEAMALGKPIVSTTIAGIPEIVGDEAGILARPGDEPGLADALTEMWTRIRSGRVSADTIRARAERLFDGRRNVGELRAMFAESARRMAA